MRIAVYAIALDEEKHVGRFLQTAREADVIVVADTGSTDKTVPMLRAGGATVYQIKISPWRFDDARNAALALVPADIEVCVSLDLDEMMAPGWRELLEKAWTTETTHAEYRHVSSHYKGGRPAAEMIGSQIHLRHGYRWRNLIHETVVPDRIKAKATRIPGMVRSHFPDVGKSRAHG
jgi:glycosyltransferase involved in cell wall biosynthesis